MGNVQGGHTYKYTKQLKVVPPCDVLVAGGGIAGAVTAIAAARAGATTLSDRRLWFPRRHTGRQRGPALLFLRRLCRAGRDL